MRDLGLELDHRGLIPLEDARERLRAVSEMARGGWHRIEGQVSQPTDFDFLWAALLSLADADEFVTEATRLVWKFSPRGFDNVAPLERYGDAILPWLASRVDDKGTLDASPWCVVPCLLGIANKGALDVLMRIRTRPQEDKERVRAWQRMHGVPTRPTTLDEGGILQLLDDAASAEDDSPMPWPRLESGAGHFERHAMRIIAAREKTGDDWGVLIEVVQGDLLDGPGEEHRWPATIQQYRYGSKVPSGGRYLEDARPIGIRRVLPKGFALTSSEVPRSFDGIKVIGPKGTAPFTMTDALLTKLGLLPKRTRKTKLSDWTAVLAVRVRLCRDPGAFWSDPRPLAKKALGLDAPVVVVATDRFEHVSGPASGERGKARRLPSKSKTYCSVAAALVHRDPARFIAGPPNSDWRG